MLENILRKKISTSDSKFLNPSEYLPEDEIHTLRQVYYLIMMLMFFIFIIYIIITPGKDYVSVAIVEFIITIYIALSLDLSSWKNKAVVALLIPYGSFGFLIFQGSYVAYLDLLHMFVYVYFMKVYFFKFKEYTESNGLGIAILLLFSIISLSFIVTCLSEGVEPLDAMVMVSNAFISNGYTVLGKSSVGKIDSILLVWGGYVLSGVGTATLTSAILVKYFHKRNRRLNERLDRIEELIKNNNKQE